jgi:thiopurine S-methyltransferase
VQAFFAENGIAARRRRAPGFDLYEAANLQLLQGDFFAVTPQLLGNVAAVYDRASLVSWTPEMRTRYVEHLTALTDTGSETLLVTLEYSQAEIPGPPFSVDAEEVRRLYSPHHAVHELERRDILAAEPRMRARGVSSLIDVCYRITRL